MGRLKVEASFYLSHPYLGGDAGLALVLSQTFKFLSNLPTSLTLIHASLAMLLKRGCINASCQHPHIPSSYRVASMVLPDVRRHHFTALPETLQ